MWNTNKNRYGSDRHLATLLTRQPVHHMDGMMLRCGGRGWKLLCAIPARPLQSDVWLRLTPTAEQNEGG